MSLETALLVSILGAAVAAPLAMVKNRNPAGWFIAGALLPIITIFILVMIEDLEPVRRDIG